MKTLLHVIGGAGLLAISFVTGNTYAQQTRSMLDGYSIPAEAGVVEFVFGSSGNIVQIKVDGCEPCRQQSYLPARGLEVSRLDRVLEGSELVAASGQSGTLIISTDTGLVKKVHIWVPRGEEGGEL